MAKRIFLTGATGAMGLEAARELVAAGHTVVGTTRSSDGARSLKEIGVIPSEVSLTDETALRDAMTGADVVAHFATSIPRGFDQAKLPAWRPNDELRREGTRALIAAAEANGVRRFIFESISLAYPDRSDAWIDEDVELEEVSPVMRTAIEAEAMLEAFHERGGEAVSLRFGRLYGAGRASRDLIEAVRSRQMPIVGRGENYVSSVHVADVGTAVAAGVDVAPGVYNVVDDEPLRQRPLMESIAESLDAPSPLRIPELVARMMMGHAARVLAVSQRVSNRRFREATDWAPRYASAVDGWRDVAELTHAVA